MNKYLGELAQSDRDTLLSTSYAALMPGAWPEPFGLVAIEALAGVCASSSTKTLPEVGSNTTRPTGGSLAGLSVKAADGCPGPGGVGLRGRGRDDRRRC